MKQKHMCVSTGNYKQATIREMEQEIHKEDQALIIKNIRQYPNLHITARLLHAWKL